MPRIEEAERRPATGLTLASAPATAERLEALKRGERIAARPATAAGQVSRAGCPRSEIAGVVESAAPRSRVTVKMVIGTPTRWLRLPGVDKIFPKSARVTAAVISLVLVLPTAPPIAITGSPRAARTRAR